MLVFELSSVLGEENCQYNAVALCYGIIGLRITIEMTFLGRDWTWANLMAVIIGRQITHELRAPCVCEWVFIMIDGQIEREQLPGTIELLAEITRHYSTLARKT